jgi:peroxiredoxin
MPLPAVVFFLCLVSLMPAPASAGGDKRAAIGPAVGSDLGRLVSFRDQDGVVRDFASLKGENGLILVFSRSLSWCPFCIADARDWSTIAEDAWSKGVSIAVVTYDPVDVLSTFGRRFAIRYPLLSDKGSVVIKELEILNEEHSPGNVAYGIPHPMVFLLDANGILRARFSETNYTHRADKNEVLAEAARLGSK